MSQSRKNNHRGGAAPGFAILGCQVAGFLGLIGGLMGVVKESLLESGVCLIASALAFGIVVYVSFTD